MRRSDDNRYIIVRENGEMWGGLNHRTFSHPKNWTARIGGARQYDDLDRAQTDASHTKAKVFTLAIGEEVV